MDKTKNGWAKMLALNSAAAIIATLVAAMALWLVSISAQLTRIETTVADMKIASDKADANMQKHVEMCTAPIKDISQNLLSIEGRLGKVEGQLEIISKTSATTKTSVESMRAFVAQTAESQGQTPVRSWLVATAPTDSNKRVGIHLIDGETGIIKTWPSVPITEQTPLNLTMAGFWAVAMTSDGTAMNVKTAFSANEGAVSSSPVKVIPECSFLISLPPKAIPEDLVARFLSTGKSTVAKGIGQPSTCEKFVQFLKDNAELLGN